MPCSLHRSRSAVAVATRSSAVETVSASRLAWSPGCDWLVSWRSRTSRALPRSSRRSAYSTQGRRPSLSRATIAARSSPADTRRAYLAGGTARRRRVRRRGGRGRRCHGLERGRRCRSCRLRRDGVVVVVLAADGAPEVAEALAQCASGLGEALRAEHQQGHYEDEQEMGGLEDVADHGPSLAGVEPRL